MSIQLGKEVIFLHSAQLFHNENRFNHMSTSCACDETQGTVLDAVKATGIATREYWQLATSIATCEYSPAPLGRDALMDPHRLM